MKDYSPTTPEETLRLLGTDPEKGLSASSSRCKLEEYGRNELKEKKRQMVWEMFLSQFKRVLDPAASGCGLDLHSSGRITDAVVIFLIVFINADLRGCTRIQSREGAGGFKDPFGAKGKGLEGGTVAEVPAADLVPRGHSFIGGRGFYPADARLLETVEFRTDEVGPDR